MQMLLGFGTISAAFLPGDDQMLWYNAVIMTLLDYIFAFSLVGLSGLFRNPEKPSKSLVLGSLVGTGARFVMHFFSGWILWGAWAASFFEGFDETTGGTFGAWIVNNFSGQGLAAVYSFIYNGFYMIPEMIITAILAFILGKIPAIRKDVSPT
jgi:thiamine transporter